MTTPGDDFYRPGPCQPYDYVLRCPLPAGSDAIVTGYAVQAASELLYYATGMQFDECQTTLWPCRRECSGAGPWLYNMPGWWEWGSGPRPALVNGSWYNIVCGSCGDNCSCTMISEVNLPGPVRRVVQVTVDGVILTPGVDYRLDNYRTLVRLQGELWPFCNNLSAPVVTGSGIPEAGSGGWTVTIATGLPLPMLGRLAMGELVGEIAKDFACGSCDLPLGVTNLTRQGMTMDLESAEEFAQSNLYNLKYVDRFIRTYNPHNLPGRAYMPDLDGPDDQFRIVNTTIT